MDTMKGEQKQRFGKSDCMFYTFVNLPFFKKKLLQIKHF